MPGEHPPRSPHEPTESGGLEQRTQELTEEVGVASHRVAPGDVLEKRFRIVRLIARGGMGEMYEALDVVLGTRVALKTLGGAGIESPGAREVPPGTPPGPGDRAPQRVPGLRAARRRPVGAAALHRHGVLGGRDARRAARARGIDPDAVLRLQLVEGSVHESNHGLAPPMHPPVVGRRRSIRAQPVQLARMSVQPFAGRSGRGHGDRRTHPLGTTRQARAGAGAD